MLFPANSAVEQEVIVAAIVIALFYLRFWCTPTHVRSKPSATLR